MTLEDPHQPGRRALLYGIGVTVLLYAVPYGHFVAYPLVLLSTFAHEMGHGMAAILAGGSFVKFEMWADGSGVATNIANVGRFGRAFISSGGLCGPAVLAALCFVMARRPRGARAGLYAFGVATLVSCLWVVRNPFGWVFVGALGALSVLVASKASQQKAQLFLVFLAVQLALSVFSRGDYLFTATAATAGGDMPSDVAQMANALFLPYWFWGALCGLFSLAVLVLGVWLFLRKESAQPAG
jgi:hypothetical protein